MRYGSFDEVTILIYHHGRRYSSLHYLSPQWGQSKQIIATRTLLTLKLTGTL